MRQLFLLLMISFTLLNAKMVDGIALIVEGEAITTAEIRAVRSQMGISKSKAIDLLIQDRLQKIAMQDIQIAQDEIDAKIAQIAKQNHISIRKMQKILKQEGTSWVSYRASIKDSLQKAHFFQEVVVASIPEPTENELKLFYNKHKRQFRIPKVIHMIEYSAKQKKVLENLIAKKGKKGVHAQKISKDTKSLGIELLSMFLQTPKRGFTKILNAGDTYITYKILSTQGKRIMPFDVAQTAVTTAWKQAQQSKALKDYFEKLRTRAEIQILR